MKLTFRGEVKNKIFIPNNENYYNHHLRKLEGKKVGVTFETQKSIRSIQQNSYYWGVVLPIIAEHTGHSSNELHEIYKRLFLPPRIISYAGRDLKMPSSTADLSISEFIEYIDRIVVHAGEMGVVIPEPKSYDMVITG